MRLVKPVNRGRFARSRITSIFAITFYLAIQRHALALDSATFDSKLALVPNTSQPSPEDDCCYTFTQDRPVPSTQTDTAAAPGSSVGRDDKTDAHPDPSIAEISYSEDALSKNVDVQFAAIDIVLSRSLIVSGLTSSNPASDLPIGAVKQPSEEDRIVDVLCAMPIFAGLTDGKNFASRMPAATDRAGIADGLISDNALPQASNLVLVVVIAGAFLLIITSRIRQA